MSSVDHITLWNKCCEFIKDNIGEQQYDIWFKDISSISFEDSTLTLLVPSDFFVDQLEERFLKVMSAAVHKTYGTNVDLYYQYYQVKDIPETAVNQLSTSQSSTIIEQRKAAPASPFRPVSRGDIDPQLNPRYNFENYCGGESNKIARAIGESIANNPQTRTFNPLFVFGPTGVGKTHLIQAIGIRMKERNPQMRVLYVTSRLFESQYTAAVANKNYNDFFHFYQSIDTLIVDDIQDLAGKKATQNIFFHIFNHLLLNNKQIIMSSDCAPSEMDGFEARLLSRFRSGMAAELSKPDLELRRQVLIRKAKQDGLELPADVIEYIAANVTDSIRELEGIVVSLIAHSIVMNCDISIELAESVIANAVKASKKPVNFEVITQEVCAHYNVDPDMLFTKSRKRDISDARQVVMYLAKTLAKMPLVEIGRHIDRTHATVNYACNAIDQRLSFDKQLQTDIFNIRAAILGC